MHRNYERLFQQLSELVSHDDVKDHLDRDETLKTRIDQLIQAKREPLMPKKGSGANDPIERRVKTKVSEDMSCKFEKIYLKENCIQPKLSAKFSNESQKVPSSKRSESKYRHERSRERISSNQSKILKERSIQRNKQTSKSKQNISSASKISPGILSKGTKSSIRQKVQSNRENRDSSLKRGRMQSKSKENSQVYQTRMKKKVSHQKTESDSDHSEIVFSKNTSNCNTIGRQTVKKVGNEVLLSRFSVSNSKKNSLSLEKQKKILETIEQKKQQVAEQKMVLQDSCRMLQERISRERAMFNASESRIGRLKLQIGKIEVNQKERSVEGRISRKKSESFFVEAKQIQSKIVEASRSNEGIVESISEQKYLIGMYKKVIEEMKSQLKVEKQDKGALKKRLTHLKNSQKMMIEKNCSKEALSDQLFNSMKEILKKWD